MAMDYMMISLICQFNGAKPKVQTRPAIADSLAIGVDEPHFGSPGAAMPVLKSTSSSTVRFAGN
jgi:hypothetical protein